MGESQGAGDRFRREEREEPDQDEAGEQGEGGGKHRRFKLRPTKLDVRAIDRGSEEGEKKGEKWTGHYNIIKFLVEEAGDDNVDDEVHGQGDKRVVFEESRHKSQ